MTHGDELRSGNAGGREINMGEGNKGEKENGTTVIASSIKIVIKINE